MRVENKHIDDIMPYHRNPRTHDKSIEHLKESIKSSASRSRSWWTTKGR